jgi:hypothetical protein
MVTAHAAAQYHRSRFVAHRFIAHLRAPPTIGESAAATADAPLVETRGGMAWNLFMWTSDGG